MRKEGVTEAMNQKMNDPPTPWVTMSSMSFTALLKRAVAVSMARLRAKGTLISFNM